MKTSIRKRLMPVLLALAMVISLLPAMTPAARADSAVWDGNTSNFLTGDCGNGWRTDPYEISTPEQLAYLAQQVSVGNNFAYAYFKLTDDIVLNDESFSFDPASGILTVTDGVNTGYLGTGLYGTTHHTTEETVSTADTWYTVAALTSDDLTTGSYGGTLNAWAPIGISSSFDFKGIFDGSGHTVSGVYINGNSDYQGLFGYISRNYANYAMVKNLGVVNSFINGRYNVGGVVGYNTDDAAIRYCYNAGIVTGRESVGGVTGSNAGTVDYCYNAGIVTGAEVVGGLAGRNYGTVQYSYNTGGVTGDIGVGGVAGTNDGGTVQYSYNTGAVASNSGTYVGGVVGFNNSGTVTYCYYDNNKCSVLGIGSNTVSADVTGSAEGKQTSNMQGVALKTGDSGDGWTASHWVFADGAYPRHTGTTAATAFEISTAAQLAYLAQRVNAGTDFDGIYFRQTADINLNEGVTFTFYADTGLVEVSKQDETAYWLGTGAKGDASGENATFDTTASTAGAIYTDSASAATGGAAFALNSWTPIGVDAGNREHFSGVFNGAEYKISGVYINNDDFNQGLFSNLGGKRHD